MLDLLHAARDNLLNPTVLFFFLGLLASLVKSDLQIPREISKGLSLYLLIAIGLKGGVELSHSGLSPQFLVTALIAVTFSFVMPLLAFPFLRRVVDTVNAATIAAHYGSVSAVTFVTATVFLESADIGYEPFMIALLALMESPAIVSGIVLARHCGGAGTEGRSIPIGAPGVAPQRDPYSGTIFGIRLDRSLLSEALLNSSVVLIFGSLLIGFLCGEGGVQAVRSVLIDPFHGVLALFLLDMGLVAGRRSSEFRAVGMVLAAFALIIPVVGGTAGALAATVSGLSVGGATLMAVLAGSASYIAVPAAIRIALPEANPSLSLTMSLAVTFPFNILTGIPLYHYLAKTFAVLM